MPFCHVTLKAARPLPPRYPNQLQTIGDHVRRKRTEIGLLQRELGARLAVDKTTVSHWERNLTSPALQHWPRILGFLGYSPVDAGEALPDRLRAYRRVNGLTQEQFARLVGACESTIRGWESGDHLPHSNFLQIVIKIIGDLT